MINNDSIFQLNETLQTINNRRSIRSFTPQEVSNQQINIILQAANTAPSAHNQQSWRFIVIKDKKKQELANLIVANSNKFPRPASTLLRMAARSISSATVVIIVVNTGGLIEHGVDLFKIEKEMANDFFRTMEIQSSAAAIENLLLAATSLGLSTVWLGILFLIKDDVLKFLDEPKGEFMAVVPVGYADKSGLGPKKRSIETMIKYL
ncbi:nitroreductase [Candidatus Desantisbacteria bacterium CG2_30_40_21]|uniref:Nitroreductase n=3 Tax=unclassified Candidatus Desantisiibacteriota TaxID=3106372 RepID=A0A2M7JA34_9BACT|nr:MAG: nitroreductase [Candidatus Desantisbacteria bacterium CG2_30_40_21]PIP42166.1 MAG: nitroreductase [Candidatus Desantisbacteria bacterium CG23_combo_of_CG06-09_8_20_14_all_40_23]PIX16270.1 MAG: nitroreductase [Candidatus Desantisbacteria bacterium CG_4_8_14_3_um_filter_40_12]